MALLAFGAFNKNTSRRVPDAHTLIKTTCRHEATIGRDGYGRDTVFNRETEDTLICLNVPESDRAVAGAGGDVAAVRGEVEGVDVLLVTFEGVANLLGGNVPDLSKSVSAVRSRVRPICFG